MKSLDEYIKEALKKASGFLFVAKKDWGLP